MAEIINLRRARKARERDAAEAHAEAIEEGAAVYQSGVIRVWNC